MPTTRIVYVIWKWIDSWFHGAGGLYLGLSLSRCIPPFLAAVSFYT
jgi:hypothetical protein